MTKPTGGVERYVLSLHSGTEHASELTVGCGLCGVFKCGFLGQDTGDAKVGLSHSYFFDVGLVCPGTKTWFVLKQLMPSCHMRKIKWKYLTEQFY